MQQRNVLAVLTQKSGYQISNQIHVTRAKRGKMHYTKTRLVLVLHLIGGIGGTSF